MSFLQQKIANVVYEKLSDIVIPHEDRFLKPLEQTMISSLGKDYLLLVTGESSIAHQASVCLLLYEGLRFYEHNANAARKLYGQKLNLLPLTYVDNELNNRGGDGVKKSLRELYDVFTTICRNEQSLIGQHTQFVNEHSLLEKKLITQIPYDYSRQYAAKEFMREANSIELAILQLISSDSSSHDNQG